MLWIFPVFLVLGLFVPGFFIAKYLRHTLWCASAFTLSLLVLFHSVFWLGVLRTPITLWTVLPCLVAVSAGAAWLGRRSAIPAESKRMPQFDSQDLILILSSTLVGAVLFARSAVSPLIGGDTLFRWDFLAQKLLTLGRFDFYPPLTAADFRTYFFVDGIPPMVSFTNWWLYASAGRYLPSLISVFVTLQFGCTLAFVYGAASAVFSRRAGVLAAAMLAGAPLYFNSVVLGQETGLTALAIAATIYFVVTARQPDDVRAMVSAGLAAALCALSREYGWIALIAGVIALLWRRQPLKQVAIFAAVATAAAAPWYVRNWILAGNPFYSLSFLNFAVNPIHTAILQYYNALFGLHTWTAATWVSLLWFLLHFATFQILAGIPGGFTQFRRRGYLIVIALVLSAVWIESAGYTSGGVSGSTRVLSPVIVVLSITGAGILETLTRRARWRTAIVIAIVLCQLWTASHGVLYPNDPSTLSLSQWPQNAFQPTPLRTEFQISDQLLKYLPPGSRVLSESAYLHAALTGKGIEVVPVWSPEVRFIFSLSPEESERQLRSLRIGSVAYYPNSLNTQYLVSASPFYTALPKRWHVLAEIPGVLFIVVP
jgi:Dolichyl-phosphate-mannose-protein mannosyltransferase